MNYLALFLFLLFPFHLFSQSSTFDSELNKLSNELAQKINLKGKKKVAVWDFTDADGTITKLGKYISEEVSINLTNAATSFQMMDRQHLSMLLKEHKLKSDGLIDEATAKRLGQLQAVDAIVTGSLTVLDGKLRLALKVLDTETALIIAANKGDLPVNSDINTFLGLPTKVGGDDSYTTNPNMGYNRPIVTNEQVNNSATVSKKCQESQTGDLCFQNLRKVTIQIETNRDKITVGSGQTACLYNLREGVCGYIAYTYKSYAMCWCNEVANGQARVDVCQSKTIIIN
jgi:TolB-like protein